MLRDTSLEEISDGRIYGPNDMVRADAGGCENCHKCCTNMGNSIVLNPLDVYNLKLATGLDFNGLLGAGYIELNMVDGLILPNLRMGENGACSFLNEEGRCKIHSYRSDICRLFPLGRIYKEDGSFGYILQTKECAKTNLTKIKVKKWLDRDNLSEYDSYISRWHSLIRKLGSRMLELRERGTAEQLNEIAMFVLNAFYVKEIVKDDAYKDFEDAIKKAEDMLHV